MTEQAVITKPIYEKMALSAHDLFAKVADENTWLKEIGFALQILRGNEYLAGVSKTQAGADSIKNAVANVALCGTTLNPALQQAFLVPRKVGNQLLCCLDISYRGLTKIATESGGVKHLAPRLVYTFDEFDYYEEDGETHIHHRANLCPPGEFINSPAKFWEYLTCGYLVAVLSDGDKAYYLYPKWKLEKAMKTSPTNSDKSPWRTHPDEMCMKTMIKHAYKTLPQTDRMSTAVSVLNEHEGLDLEAEKKERTKDIVARFEEIKPEPCPKCAQVGGHLTSCPDAEPPEE